MSLSEGIIYHSLTYQIVAEVKNGNVEIKDRSLLRSVYSGIAVPGDLQEKYRTEERGTDRKSVV